MTGEFQRALTPELDAAYLLPHFRWEGDELCFLGQPVPAPPVPPQLRAALEGDRPLGEWADDDAFSALLSGVRVLHRGGALVLWRSRPPVQREKESFDLYLSPHSDDIAFSSGGLLLERRSIATPVIINVFSDSGWTIHCDRFDGADSRSRITELRKSEDRFLARLVGGRAVFLGLIESIYRPDDPAAEEGDERRRLTDRLAAHLWHQLERYDVRALIAPLGIGGHPDHTLICNVAARLAPAALSRGIRVLFYEDFPYLVRHDDRELRLAKLARAGLRLERRAVSLDGCMFDRLQLFGVYRSQIRADDVGELLEACARGAPPGSGHGEHHWEAVEG